MKKITTITICLMLSILCFANEVTKVSGPDGRLKVSVQENEGKVTYSVDYGSTPCLLPSPLGLKTNAGDFSSLRFVSSKEGSQKIDYRMNRSKTASVCKTVNTLVCTFENPDGRHIDVEFAVSDNDVALRYLLPREAAGSARIFDELTGFRLQDNADNTYLKTFLTPQSDAMIGWMRTKPSYEEYYGVGKPATAPSEYGHGYTFPCLFQLGNDAWVLISETGVDSRFCGSRLGEYKDGMYKMEFPMAEENDGNGTVEPAIALPGATPWRTITVADNLKPIVETTVTWDVVEPRYETVHDYKFGKGTWSWIVWQDGSINMADQKKYVDLASAMGFDYVLVDNWWDQTIGHENIPELVSYANERNVDVFLWYSSSGYWNDISQSPINIMDNPIARKAEMKWLQKQGIKGIKVDFFGGDKQETMRLYEAILSDADDHGLMVIFHGCTIPRGWEKMYPNYVGSEAVRASENLVFMQSECDQEAIYACLHPFIRNTVGCMEFGGCFLNKRLDRTNEKGTIRRTTDLFQIATCVLFQNPIQNFALAPNNLEDGPEVCLDFLREVPTTWDETRYISGYPGSSVVLARRCGEKWYMAAVNAEAEDLKIDLKEILEREFPEYKDVTIYSGGNKPVKTQKVKKMAVPQNDGLVVVLSL